MGEDMEKETYDLKEFKRIFDIQNKSLSNWLVFKVKKSGVKLIPQYTALTPAGDDLFNGEELLGRKEELKWHPLLELKKQTKMQKERDRYTPKISPPSERAVELIKKRIKKGEKEVIIPPSPPMEPDWEMNPDFGKTLLTFPCSKEELISFIKIAQLDDRIKSESDRQELLSPTEIEHTHSESVQEPYGEAEQQKTTPKGGAPKSTITEAVERAYDELVKSGNTEIVKRGNVRSFLQYLKESITPKEDDTQGNANLSEYLSERIKDISKPGGAYKITIHPLRDKEILKVEKTGKNITYSQNRISTILTNLRNKK